MNKHVLTLAIAATAAMAQPTLAQNTAQAHQFRIDMCTAVARQSANAFRFKKAGLQYVINLPQTPGRTLTEWGVRYATNEAVSAEDAYKVAAAVCLDNIDKAYRDDRNGHPMTVDELYAPR